ncbi:MAG: WYL domain-containing protein [Deltaproteobacteria bacterium]|nr:WYL domain-containing protein [Deltaproteobacteria bacterium]
MFMPIKKTDKNRYSRLEDILQLALKMQTTEIGISLEDIERIFAVSRRTAERMRDAVIKVFANEECQTRADGKKYWRLGRNSANLIPAFSADEFARLQRAIRLLKSEGRKKDAAVLTELQAKLTNWLSPSKRAAIETDISALTEAEGIAARPRPRPIIDDSILLALRSAILARRKVKISYYSRARSGTGEQTIAPYGFIYGNRHYLVAWSKKAKDYRYFTLGNIKSVEILKDTYEARDFSLKTFSRRSFGVYQENKVYNVIWKFSKKVAADALEFKFHPTQTVEKQKDGTVIVAFTACGLLEMVWHLITWGSEVKIIAPTELKTLYQEHLNKLKGVYK